MLYNNIKCRIVRLIPVESIQLYPQPQLQQQLFNQLVMLYTYTRTLCLYGIVGEYAPIYSVIINVEMKMALQPFNHIRNNYQAQTGMQIIPYISCHCDIQSDRIGIGLFIKEIATYAWQLEIEPVQVTRPGFRL